MKKAASASHVPRASGAKRLLVFLSRHFKLVGLFLLAVNFFPGILLPLQLDGFGEGGLNLPIQPFRKHYESIGIQERGAEKVDGVLRILPPGDHIFS
jgi:hypothetical protein